MLVTCNLHCRWRGSTGLTVQGLCKGLTMQVLMRSSSLTDSKPVSRVMQEKSPPFSYPSLTKLSWSFLKDSHSLLVLNIRVLINSQRPVIFNWSARKWIGILFVFQKWASTPGWGQRWVDLQHTLSASLLCIILLTRKLEPSWKESLEW